MKKFMLNATLVAFSVAFVGCDSGSKGANSGSSGSSNGSQALLLAPEKVAMPKDKEWLGAGEVIDTSEYAPNAPHSPAAFSHINKNTLFENQQKGQKIYAKWCSSCHGIDMPGTRALQALYKGDLPAVLEDRTDLSVELVELFVRNGKHSMPFFRKSEISDEELKLLGEYLSRNAQQ